LIYKSHLTISRRTNQTMKKSVIYTLENTVAYSVSDYRFLHQYVLLILTITVCLSSLFVNCIFNILLLLISPFAFNTISDFSFGSNFLPYNKSSCCPAHINVK